jgi:hypothetical protein
MQNTNIWEKLYKQVRFSDIQVELKHTEYRENALIVPDTSLIAQNARVPDMIENGGSLV